MNRKLYRVTCRGMTSSFSSIIHGIAYVVATNPTEAYEKLRNYLDTAELGFRREREMEKVELLAEETKYPDCGIALFI